MGLHDEQHDPAKDDPAKDDPAKDDPAKDDPAKDDPAKDDPAKDERVTVWEVAQYLARALDQKGIEAAGRLMARFRNAHPDYEVERARDLAYRLFALCEAKRWARRKRGPTMRSSPPGPKSRPRPRSQVRRAWSSRAGCLATAANKNAAARADNFGYTDFRNRRQACHDKTRGRDGPARSGHAAQKPA